MLLLAAHGGAEGLDRRRVLELTEHEGDLVLEQRVAVVEGGAKRVHRRLALARHRVAKREERAIPVWVEKSGSMGPCWQGDGAAAGAGPEPGGEGWTPITSACSVQPNIARAHTHMLFVCAHRSKSGSVPSSNCARSAATGAARAAGAGLTYV